MKGRLLTTLMTAVLLLACATVLRAAPKPDLWPRWQTHDQKVIEHLRRFAEPTLQEKLKGVGSIAGYTYDWSLNAP